MNNTLKIIVIAIIAIIATFFVTKCTINKANNADISNLLSAYTDTLTFERNEKGQLEVTTSVLETNNLDLMELLGVKDSTIRRVTDQANRYNRRNSELLTAMAIDNQIFAEYKDSVSNLVTEFIMINDTLYPTYERDFNLFNPYDNTDSTAWIIGKVLLGKLDFNISLLAKNEYDIAVYRERKNMFSKYKTYVTLVNRNPYDETRELRTLVTNTPKRKHFVVAGGLGYGYGNDGFGLNVSILIGYKLFEF